MQRDNNTPLADEYLQSLEGMSDANVDPFFYTRLKGRMQQAETNNNLYKPTWIIGALLFFIVMNTWMIFQKEQPQQNAEKKSSLQEFAKTFNLNSDSNY